MIYSGHFRLGALQESPEAFGSSYEDSVLKPREEAIGRLKSEPGTFVLGCLDDEALIGAVGFVQEKGTKVQHSGFIPGLYVVPERRGQGIGKRLMEEAISRASTNETIEQIHLTVVVKNVSAQKMYESLGFRVCGIAPRALKVNGQYLDENVMYLPIRDQLP